MLAKVLVLHHQSEVLLDQVEELFRHFALDQGLQFGLLDRIGSLNQGGFVHILFGSRLETKKENDAGHLWRNVEFLLVYMLN